MWPFPGLSLLICTMAKQWDQPRGMAGNRLDGAAAVTVVELSPEQPAQPLPGSGQGCVSLHEGLAWDPVVVSKRIEG